MKRRHKHQHRHAVAPESPESIKETLPPLHGNVASKIPEAITKAIAMKYEEFIVSSTDEQILSAITVWKPQTNSDNAICSHSAQDAAKTSRADTDFSASPKVGTGFKATDKTSHNSSAQEPSCRQDPDGSHVSFSCGSIRDQSLARFANNISNEMLASKSAEHRCTGPDHMEVENQHEKNAAEEGDSDPFVLLDIPTLECQVSGMDSSTESLRLSMEEAEQSERASVPKINKTILKNSEADAHASTADGSRGQHFMLMQQQKKACSKCPVTQENNCALNMTSGQAKASAALDNNAESTHDSMCTLPAGDHEKQNNNEDLPSEPLCDQSEVCNPVGEGCSFLSDDIGQLDSSGSLDDLDKSILAYAKHQQVPNTSTMVAKVMSCVVPGQLESSYQSGDVYVVHSTQADNNSESQGKLSVLNLSPIREGTSRASLVGNRNEVLTDKHQQSYHMFSQNAEGSAVDVDGMKKDQMSTDDVIILPDSKTSSAGDGLIIISSSSDRDSNNELCGIRSSGNKKVQRLLRLDTVDGCEAEEESLEVSSNDSIKTQDGCSPSILQTNTELTDKTSPQLNTSEDLSNTEISHIRNNARKTRTAKHKGKQTGKFDLFSAFPRMPGWGAHSLGGKRELVKSCHRQQATERSAVGKSPGKRKLFNRHDVLVCMSPDAEAGVSCRTASVGSGSNKSCPKCKKASVIPIGRRAKRSNSHSVIGYSRRPDFVACGKSQCSGSNLRVVRDQQAVAEIYSLCISENSLKSGQPASNDSCFARSKRLSERSVSISVSGRHVAKASVSECATGDDKTITEPDAKKTCLNSMPERLGVIHCPESDADSMEKHAKPREEPASGLKPGQPQQHSNKSLYCCSQKEANNGESSKHGMQPASSDPQCISSVTNAFQELLDTNGFVLKSNSSLYKARFSGEVKGFVNDYVKQLNCK